MAKDKKKKETSTSSSMSNMSDAPTTRISISSSDSGFSKNSQDTSDQGSFGEVDDIPGASSSLLVASSAASNSKKKHRFSIRNLLGGKKESSKELSPGRNVTQSTSSLDDMKKTGLVGGTNIGVSLDAPTLDTSDSSDQALLDLQRRIKESDVNGNSSMSPSSPTNSGGGNSSSSPTSGGRSNNSPRVSSPIASSVSSLVSNNEKLIPVDEFERLKNCEQELSCKLVELKNCEELLSQTNAKHKQETEEKEVQLQQLKKNIEELTNQCEELKNVNTSTTTTTTAATTVEPTTTMIVDTSIIVEQLKKEHEEQLSAVKNENLTLLEQTKKDFTTELNQFKNQVENLQSSITKLTKEKEEQETKVKELTSENEGLMDDLVNLDSRASDVKKTLEKKNKDLTTEIDQLEKKLKESKESQIIEQGEKIVSNTTGDHAEKVKAEFEKLKRWNQDLNDMLTLEQQSMSNTEKERDQLALKVEELEKKLEQVSAGGGSGSVEKNQETNEDVEQLMKNLEEITLERDVLEELRQEELLEYEREKEELAGEILALKEELEKLTIPGGTSESSSTVNTIVATPSVVVVPTVVDNGELDNLKKLVQSLQSENQELKESIKSKPEKVVEKQVEKIVEKIVEKVIEVEKIVEVEKVVEVEKIVEKLVAVGGSGDGGSAGGVVEMDNLRDQIDTLVNQLDQSQEQVRDYEKQFESDRLILEQLKKELANETQKAKNVENELKKAKNDLEKQLVSSVSTASVVVSAEVAIDKNPTNSSSSVIVSSDSETTTAASADETTTTEQDGASIRPASFETPVISSLEKEDLYKIRSKYNYYDSDDESNSSTTPASVNIPTTAVKQEVEEEEEEEPASRDDDIYQDELKKFEKDLDKVLGKASINLSKGKISSLKELELLCIKLKFNKTAKILDLSGNTSIDNRGLKIICDMLRWNTTLTDLYLEDTSITTLNPHLFDVFNENFKLSNVAFSEDHIPSAELDKLDTLLDRNETY